ncbi:hypothetical protein L2E82_17430 [Cichorium intybus]|uniref:Uncharacterized protein n=1 Tax=Cichorium intybus TaxID=13427 RepID=A0ACB9F8S9_CICIN|nr:hypothetical protein L2E82_17430 [Cichorium intybus]
MEIRGARTYPFPVFSSFKMYSTALLPRRAEDNSAARGSTTPKILDITRRCQYSRFKYEVVRKFEVCKISPRMQKSGAGYSYHVLVMINPFP